MLAVVIYHSGIPLPGGFTGVDMFFVISGYVITLMLMREWHQNGRIHLGNFYLRRFKRLVPALGVMVSVTLLASLFFLPPIGEENRVLYTAAGALLFAANFVIDLLTGDYFAVRSQTNPLLHTWTLAVEEQFYVLFPLLLIAGLLIGSRWWNSRRGALLVITAVSTVSFGLAVIASIFELPVGESLFGFYSPVSRAWEFGVGALIALLHPWLRSLTSQYAGSIAVFGAILVTAGLIAIDSTTPFPGLWTLLPVLGTAALLIAGELNADNPTSRALSGRALGWIGDLSYSLYLWHWPIIVIVHLTWPSSTTATVIAAAASLIPATASYYFIERRFRHAPTPDRRSIVLFIAKVIWLPVLTWVAAWWIATRIVAPFVRDEIGQPTLDNIADESGCITEEGFSADWADQCWWGQQRPGEPIYLIGDSNAAHFGESIIGVGENLDRPVQILTAPSCIPLREMTVVYDFGVEVFPWCSEYNRFVYDYLDQAQPGTVVIAFSDVLSWSDDRFYLPTPDAQLVGGSESKAELLESLLLADANSLVERGHDLAFVKTVPQFRTPGPPWDPQECNLVQLAADDCARDVTIESLDSTQRFNRDAITHVAVQTGSPLVDPRQELCDDEVCSTGDNGFLTYRDDIHISVAEAKRLIPYFETALSKG